MKMFIVALLQVSTLTGLLCIPCDYKIRMGAYGYNNYKVWQCPYDELCIQNQDVCAPPPYNIPRCPSGGDFGNDSCTEDRCNEIGMFKCPFDPYCVYNRMHACKNCACNFEVRK